ncbi:zinc finger protein 235 [Biomphalaria pfeifferi]|uniref:Zinc finger protein 235 n=1 Tax=Biomphalaria pfeifferi TaxID=112525 RepID=A0AAD8B5B5_BIOPF|nr:zinc finger protein 235 [Biomphalaria pfeifferi]
MDLSFKTTGSLCPVPIIMPVHTTVPEVFIQEIESKREICAFNTCNTKTKTMLMRLFWEMKLNILLVTKEKISLVK